MDIDGLGPSSPAKAPRDSSSDTDFEAQAESEEDDPDDDQAGEDIMVPEEKAFMKSLGWGVECRNPNNPQASTIELN
jgi:hypothetical protein